MLGTLKMIMPVGMPAAVRVHALRALQTMHPGIVLDVSEADEPLTLLRSPFDIMLHLGPSPSRDGWFSRVLMRLPLSLVASPAYLEREGTPTTPADLAGHRLLAWRVAGRYANAWPLADGGSLPITPALLSANPELLATLAGGDGGIALVPGVPGLFQPPGLELVPVLTGVVGGDIALRALTPRATGADPRLRALIDNAQRLLARMGMA